MSCVWVMLYGPDEYLYYQANSLGAIEINVASLGPIEFSEISLMPRLQNITRQVGALCAPVAKDLV